MVLGQLDTHRQRNAHPYLTPYTRINSARMRDRNIKSQSYKIHRILKETGQHFHGTRRSHFLDRTSKEAMKAKLWKLDFIKTKNAWASKDTTGRLMWKRQSRNERKYLQIIHLMRKSQQHATSALTPEAGMSLGYHHHRGVLLICRAESRAVDLSERRPSVPASTCNHSMYPPITCSPTQLPPFYNVKNFPTSE